MSRRKPWETTGPPPPQSKREKGRDQLFKEKKVGVPERDKLPKPGGVTGSDVTDWTQVLTPITSNWQAVMGRNSKHLDAFVEELRGVAALREETTAARGVIEDKALAEHDPIIGQKGRETTKES